MIKSLANRKNITVRNCDEEPIHIPGSIQPHGFLMAIQIHSFAILYCSENCEQCFSLPLKDILGSTLYRFFSEDTLANIGRNMENAENDVPLAFIFMFKAVSYSAIIHKSSKYVIIEFEPLVEEVMKVSDIYIQVNRFTYYTERGDNLKGLCEDIAKETRNITGYDRVMIYRFDEQFNGEVFAENRRDDLEPFLGLHYPHTDIPAQARELFMRNNLRILVDVNYTPVPIYTLQETDNEPESVDLSLVTLRSFSPIHIQYLINMGVVATLNISIIQKGRLWGLISCHHYSPKNIPYYVRLAAQLQSTFLSSQIDVRQTADEFEFKKASNAKLSALRSIFHQEEQDILADNNLILLKDLLNADGVVLAHDKKLHSVGNLPSENAIRDLLKWLTLHCINGFYSTEYLSGEYPAASSYSEQIAGVNYLRLDKSNDCILWTLAEQERFVNWGGNPEKAVESDNIDMTLSPRTSFALWRQQVKNKSRPWKSIEINTAQQICSSIQNQLHINYLKAQQAKYNDVDIKLRKANDELANMNWISIHDLKEPLRKIQLYASMIIDKHGKDIPDMVKLTLSRMQASADKMQMLTEDLLNFSNVVTGDSHLVNTDLKNILQIVSDDVRDELEEIGGTMNIGNLPVVKGIDNLLIKMFVNIIRNSIKFARPGVPLLINIDFKIIELNEHDFPPTISGPSCYCVSISDNGIGFNQQYRKEIFRLFHRLNPRQSQGSGAGLAISKKIIESCGGYIDAIGEIGKGATFNVYFPIQLTGKTSNP